MLQLNCSEVMKATGGVLLSGSADTAVDGVCTDSRKMLEGRLFIPLAGDRYDGHDYIEASFKAGAAAALTQKDACVFNGKALIRVADTCRALRDLAAYYRSKFGIPFVGVTGSVGKTATKDMTACVLGRKYKVLKTEGNFNNEVGLPLSIFNLDGSQEAAVLEMGMSGFGEISRLTAIVRPDVAIVTNIGLSHIEKLGSRQNILKAKMEILEGLKDGGLVVLNGDDGLLRGTGGLIRNRVVLYGMEDGADYQAYNINSCGESGINFDIMLDGREYGVHVPVPGVHNVYNALAALAAGRELGIPSEEIAKGISEYVPGDMRLNIISVNGIKVINDTYNASPLSMEAAINVLDEIGGTGRKIAVLGDMLELGDWAGNAHLGVGRHIAGRRIDMIVTVGMNARHIAEGAVKAGFPGDNTRSFENNVEVCGFLGKSMGEGDVILVKGSRGMHMEEIVKELMKSNK